MLWEHETGHAYSEQGLATRQEPDGLPPVEWLTYGSGYLAGMKLGGTPLVEYTRDRLHRETARSFGGRAVQRVRTGHGVHPQGAATEQAPEPSAA